MIALDIIVIAIQGLPADPLFTLTSSPMDVTPHQNTNIIVVFVACFMRCIILLRSQRGLYEKLWRTTSCRVLINQSIPHRADM
ncbi:unnamed protein product [Cylicocyclus nassatus]|uniref:Uncharacterized protein n=1 Tax=Cylicocyclus nassatus TaxID=53992 RepID=A0AA36DSD6_CYLNA|nr:unnamed protein product [Cylicocyclus nassatus]